MLIIVVSTLLSIFLLTLCTTRGKKFKIATIRILRFFFVVFAPVLITLLIVKQFNIYPRGYWVTKVLFWVVFFLIMILFAFGSKSVMGKVERIIYRIFFYLPLWVIPFLSIPFIGGGTALLFYVSFIGDKSFIIYSDDHIRIERQGIRFMGPDPPLEIYVKNGLFSNKDTVLPIHYNGEEDSLRVTKLNDSTYLMVHFAPDNFNVPGGIEEFRFSIDSD